MNIPRQYSVLSRPSSTLDETVYSVAEYITLVNGQLKPLKATIRGEIGKIKYYPKAVYFSLFDKDRSVINCLIWISRLQSLGIELKEGMEVKIQGFPDVYSQTGFLTFKADAIIPVGEGALKLAYERLKAKLDEEGYFRQERKRYLPRHVERIGIITSGNGVVIRDFLQGLGNRGVKIYFYDVSVEGLHAIEDIVTAVQWFNENTQDIEALIIARGGGSLERLQPFNSIEVAKAIYGSRIPVMTAIGHETDVTIADLVADVRASVPMDAGHRLAKQWIAAEERIGTIERSIVTSFRSACRNLEVQLEAYETGFVSSYARYLLQSKQQIEQYQSSLMRCFRDLVRRVKSIEDNFGHNYERFSVKLLAATRRVDATNVGLLRNANIYFAAQSSKLTHVAGQLANSQTRFSRFLRSLREEVGESEVLIEREAARMIAAAGKKLNECERMLLACDPHLKLRQGYSIVRNKMGKVVKSSKTIKLGDRMEVQLSEGSFKSDVKEVI